MEDGEGTPEDVDGVGREIVLQAGNDAELGMGVEDRATAVSVSLATSLSPKDLMLSSKALLSLACQSASLPGTASLLVNPMYMISFSLCPLSPVMLSLGKQSLAREREASPVETPPLVSPHIP